MSILSKCGGFGLLSSEEALLLFRYLEEPPRCFSMRLGHHNTKTLLMYPQLPLVVEGVLGPVGGTCRERRFAPLGCPQFGNKIGEHVPWIAFGSPAHW
jgi:hypothetical protein